MLVYNSRSRKFAPPASGSKAILFSNSKGDTAGGLGQWFDTICNTNGWIPQNRNQISNGGFERTGTAGWQGLSPGGTIARVTGAGNTHNGSAGAGQLFYAGATPASVFASPYNPAATSWGVDTSPDTNGMRLGMVGGMTYTLSAWMMTPGSGASQAPANSFYVAAYTRIGAGSYVQTNGNTVANDGAFHQSSVTFAVPLGATEAFVRVFFVATNATAYVLFDDCQLERVAGPMGTTPTAYGDYYTRAAISGSYLQNNDAAFMPWASPYNTIKSDAYDTLAPRVYPFTPDIVFMQYNINDLYYTAAAGATTPTSVTTWRACIAAILAAIKANLPNAKVVVLGASNTIFPFTGNAYAFGAGSLDAAIGIMDGITRQEVEALGPNFLFVPIRPYMDVAYCSPLAGDGKHPSRPYGMDLVAQIVQDALTRG